MEMALKRQYARKFNRERVEEFGTINDRRIKYFGASQHAPKNPELLFMKLQREEMTLKNRLTTSGLEPLIVGLPANPFVHNITSRR